MTQNSQRLFSAVPIRNDERQRLDAISPGIEIRGGTEFLDMVESDSVDSDTTILYSFRVPRGLLDRCPGLQWFQSLGAGQDRLAGTPIMESDVAISTASGIDATPIAEYVIGTLLGFYRWIIQADRAQMEGRWADQAHVASISRELRGRTIGIIGYGSIGREVARLAKPFGTRILAVKRNPSQPEDSGYCVDGTGDPSGAIPEAFYGQADLMEVLPQCDVVVLAVPSTPETRGLMGAEQFAAMKQGSYLVNIARGNVVDEPALIDALNANHLAGAALDVFTQEPLPESSPFWTMENVLITPHISGASRPHMRRVFELFAENLERFVNGRPLMNLVDKTRGY